MDRPRVRRLLRPQVAERQPAAQVSTIELFFDLVFVFTITQLTSLVGHDPTPRGVAQAALELGVVWWMYGGYAWLTNAVARREDSYRLLLLVGMAGFLVVSMAVPNGFGTGGLAFGLGYLVVNLVHLGMFTRSGEVRTLRGLLSLSPFNLASASLVLAAGFVAGPADWALWSAAFGLQWATPYLTRIGEFSIRPAHFVERHGLVVIIALGESIVALGIATQARPLSTTYLLAAGLGLILAAALWWQYFGSDHERAEHALDAVEPAARPWLAVRAFGYAFLPMLGGIVLVAAGVKLALLHADGPEPLAGALFVAAGTALYVGGQAWFRRLMGLGRIGVRLATALLSLATAPLGLVAAAAQLAVLTAVLVAGLLIGRRVDRSGYSP